MDRMNDSRGKGLTRLPGETRIEQLRRMQTYEGWRERFEEWILDEGRSHSWIGTKIGKSRQTVVLMAQALEIYTRKSLEMKSYQRVATRPVEDEHDSQPITPTLLGVNADLPKIRKHEMDFQAMRLAYCSAWDRGW